MMVIYVFRLAVSDIAYEKTVVQYSQVGLLNRCNGCGMRGLWKEPILEVISAKFRARAPLWRKSGISGCRAYSVLAPVKNQQEGGGTPSLQGYYG